MVRSLLDSVAEESGTLLYCGLLNVLAFSFCILAASSFTSYHIPLGCSLGFPSSVPSCGTPNALNPWATHILIKLSDTHA